MNIEWIPVSEGSPIERPSMFAKYKGTPKWRTSMFASISDNVLVTVEFPDRTRIVVTGCTHDGKWFAHVDVAHRVVAWAYYPEPFRANCELWTDEANNFG